MAWRHHHRGGCLVAKIRIKRNRYLRRPHAFEGRDELTFCRQRLVKNEHFFFCQHVKPRLTLLYGTCLRLRGHRTCMFVFFVVFFSNTVPLRLWLWRRLVGYCDVQTQQNGWKPSSRYIVYFMKRVNWLPTVSSDYRSLKVKTNNNFSINIVLSVWIL